MDGFIAGSELNKRYGISVSTLRSLANTGKISVKRVGENRKRLYCERDVRSYLSMPDNTSSFDTTQTKNVVIYTRVSSSLQRGDLERQVQILSEHVEGDKQVIKEIASALDYRRRGLLLLLERIIDKRDISRLVILSKDRVLRFGYELFERLCERHGVEIQVISNTNDKEQLKSREIEVAEDLFNIISYFTTRKNGLKVAIYERLRSEIEKDTSVSDERTEIVNEQI